MEDTKKQVRLQEIYCLRSSLKTSRGTLAHGDRIKLPPDEATRLINEGKAK